MARVYYERLSDESAEYLEREESRRREHTAMILVFEAGPFATEEGGVDFDRIREIVEARLPELPRLRTKLRRVPFENHPVWVDDQEFNLDYHLRQSSLPRPGNREQLCRTAARIAAGRLDRSRPLWDCWVIEGLEGGRFAVVLKMHKALAHLEGADLIGALLSADAEERTAPGPRLVPRPAPSPIELFRREIVGRWSPTRSMFRRARRLLQTPDRANRDLQKRATRLLRALGYRLRPAGESPFDGNLGPHRAYALGRVDLESVQAIRQSLGGSVHDVVLAILTGALRRYVANRRVSPATIDLRAVTPILDAGGEEAEPWIIELPIWEPTVLARHDVLREQTRRIRAESDVASAATLFTDGEWNAVRIFSIGARALHRIDTGQIAILQSPGSRESLHLDGARLAECYGILPLQDASALGITVMSYAGALYFAFNVDPDVVPGVADLCAAIDVEVETMAAEAMARGPALHAVAGTV